MDAGVVTAGLVALASLLLAGAVGAAPPDDAATAAPSTAAPPADSPPPAPAPNDTPWNIRSRTSSVEKSADLGRIFSFLDDVVITHGDLIAESNEARYLEAPRRAILTGQVVMRQDSTVVRAPLAYYDRDARIARFPQGVLIERPTGTAVGDVGIWRRDEDKFELRGRAAAADTSGTLDADAMTYDTVNDVFWAVGDVRMVDDVTGIVVEGQSLRYDRAEGIARVAGEPTATFEDDDGVPVHVASERMTYDPRTKVAVAEGDVHIRRKAMHATTDQATFYRQEDRVVLTGSPSLVDGSTVVSGDRIEMRLIGPGRRTIRVRGQARVSNRFLNDRERPLPPPPEEETPAPAPEPEAPPEEPAPVPPVPEPDQSPEEQVEAALAPPPPDEQPPRDEASGPSEVADTEEEADPTPRWLKIPSDRLPTENLLFGEEIFMDLVDDEIRRVDVAGFGRSKFFPSEETGELTEWNDVTGDTLHVWFTSSEVDSVHVLGNGSGEYRLPAGEFAGKSAGTLRESGKLVDYTAPRIRYIRASETMHLDKGAEVSYKTMTLSSGTIDFEAKKEIMTAAGDPPPVLIDREDEIRGREMNYHLPTEKGEIAAGRTQFENGYYRGRDIWKMGEDVLAVDHAQFTTCDLDVPHYQFSCRNMKIYLDDKMVARPVVLKIRNIPVFVLPFYMASLRKERHSGFLLPNLELGVDDNRGRFIRNLGYYWAPSDYADVTTTLDFYPQQDRVVGYVNGRYHARYRFEGRAGVKVNRDVPRDLVETAIEVEHRQTFSEKTRLTASARFLSSRSIYRDIDDAQRLNRDLRSHATFTKQFEGARNLRVEAVRQENLDNGSFTETLPTVAFTQSSRPVTGRKSGTTGKESGSGWLDAVYYSLDLLAVNQRTRNTLGEENRNVGSSVGGRLTTTQDLLRYLRISPAGSWEATWIDEDRRGEPNAFRATYNASLTARTDIYGTSLRAVGPVRGFRHVIRPSMSWTWAPEFREYFFVEEGDTTGTLQDRFLSFGGIRGTQRKTNRMSFSLGNLIQTKFARGEQERRYDLFNLNSTISYDLLAEEQGRKPLSSLSSSMTVLSSAPVNQTWSVAHDPYTWNLLSSSVTTRIALSSRMFSRGGSGGGGGSTSTPPGDDGLVGEPGFDDPVTGGRSASQGRFRAGEWQATVSHTSRRGATSGSTSSNLVLATHWSPTSKWDVRFDATYDLKSGENTSQSWTVNRSIHCWQLAFDRRLLGGEWQYYVRINVTDLPDIQAERGDKFRGRRGGGSFPGVPGF